MSIQANVSMSDEPVSQAYGQGIDYFELSANERMEVIAANSTLQKDEWNTLNDAMVQAYQANLVAVNDLQNAGLTRNVSLATKVDLYETINEFTEASVSMDGETDGDEDRTVYQLEGVPIPITHKEFRVSDRDLQSSRRLGNDLQTDGATAATRVVTEMLERLVFNGWDSSVTGERLGQFPLHGYTTHPDRNTVTGSDWGTAGNIRDDIVAMLDALDQDNRTGGGFWLYIAPPQWREFRSAIDPDGDGNLTVRERIMNEFASEIGMVRRAEHLTDGEAVMVDPSPDVVQLVTAENVQMIEWQSLSGFTDHFKIFGAMAPEIKSDQQGRSGIVHTTSI